MRVSLGNREFDIEEPRRGGLRWAIGSSDTARSSTWRFWGNKKGDFYLAARSIGGLFKTSFHRDGNCFAGFTREYVTSQKEKVTPVSERFVDAWRLDTSSSVRAFQILIPSTELRSFPTRDEDQMKWLPTTPPGAATTVSLFIAHEEFEGDEWPGARFGSEPIGIIITKSRLAWLVAKAHSIGPDVEKELESLRAQVRSHWPPDQASLAAVASEKDKSGFRVMVSGNRPTSERFCVEFAWDSIESAA